MAKAISYVFPIEVTGETAVQRMDDAVFGLGAWNLAPFTKEFSKRLSESITVHRWAQDNGNVTVDLTINLGLPVNLVSIMSEDVTLAREVGEKLSEILALPSAKELATRAQFARNPLALIHAALAQNDFDPTLSRAITTQLRSPEPAWRMAAAQAAALAGWKELANDVAGALGNEKDQEISRTLMVALQKTRQ